MTFVMCDYHGHVERLSDSNDAGALFDEQASSILPHGHCGQSIWFGPAEDPVVLRVDIDVDAGRAALRWLPDGAHAVELDPGDPISVLESADSGLVSIPASLVRVSAATARRVVIEYVATGTRPTGVRWSPAWSENVAQHP